MKIRISEASTLQIDWLVTKCEGLIQGQIAIDGVKNGCFNPTYDWSQGGPIIERMEIALCVCGTRWEAARVIDIAGGDTDTIIEYGPTPLVAAMRCYVASKLGEYVEVPF